MLARLRAAWQALLGGRHVAATACSRCADLEQDRNYWRQREERATAALLARDAGVVGVTDTTQAPTKNAMSRAMGALAISAIDTKRTSSQPGQGEMSGHARRA